jgi:anti-sigma B factor antagonist
MEYKSRTDGNTIILNISGSLDRYTSAPVNTWFEKQISPKPTFVIVNLEGVTHLDSSGLSTLISGLKRLRTDKGDLCLCCMPNQIRILFELTRLNKAFEIYPTEDAAVQAISRKIRANG